MFLIIRHVCLTDSTQSHWDIAGVAKKKLKKSMTKSMNELSGTTQRLSIHTDSDTAKNVLKSLELWIPLTKENSGHGATILFGYKYALEHGADYVFQTDSDGQTVPSEFAPFWGAKDKYDIIIGYRNKRRDGLSRVFVTRVLRLVVHLLM